MITAMFENGCTEISRLNDWHMQIQRFLLSSMWIFHAKLKKFANWNLTFWQYETSTCMIVIVHSSPCPVPPPYVLCPLPFVCPQCPFPSFSFLPLSSPCHHVRSFVIPFLPVIPSSLPPLSLSISPPLLSLPSPYSLLGPSSSLGLHSPLKPLDKGRFGRNLIVFDFIWNCFSTFNPSRTTCFLRSVAPGVLNLWMIPV